MKNSTFVLAYIALATAGASALIIAMTHLFWAVPLWAHVGPQVSAEDVQKYLGMLLGAILTAGIGFNAWLVSFYQMRREGRGDIHVGLRLLPLLLLLPCVVHFIGFQQFNYREIARNQAIVDQYHSQKIKNKAE